MYPIYTHFKSKQSTFLAPFHNIRQRNRLSIVLYLIFSFSTLTAQTVFAQLKQAIQKSLAEQELTGVVWSIVDSDGRIRTDCVGLKNTSTKEPLQPTDKVHVGSIAKTVLAAGILHLATEGKIRLDDPVTTYLPDINFINPWKESNPVTVRHLLDHTSGLSDIRLWHLFSTSADPHMPLSALYQNNPDVLRIQTKPGLEFSYSNMGYTLLGMVIESITHLPYEKYLDRNLLRPLGMLHSTFEFVSQEGKSADSSLAMGHLDKGEPYAAVPVYIRPAGQFTTTAYDMGLFLRFMMSDGRINGKEFISRKLVSQIGKPSTTYAAKNGLPNGYALGAFYRDKHGVIGLAHAGNIVGYHAMLYMFPAEQKAFFVSHNIDKENADYEIFNRLLIKELNIPTLELDLPETAAKKTTAKKFEDWNGYYIPTKTKVEPFRLLDYLSGYTKISVQTNGATLIPFQNKPITLFYQGEQRFRAADKIRPSHVFYTDEEHNRFITSGVVTLKKTDGWRILLVNISFIAGMLAMVYLFISGICQLIRSKRKVWQQAIIWHFLSQVWILISLGILITQPFISLGDPTTGSIGLAIGTVLLPLLTLVSILKYRKADLSKPLFKFDLFSLVVVFQLLIVLALNGLIPLMLWK
ncbi:serine hydrolase domain-containing protein [Cytophagaceae bacterium DM2B3-1]|uniref:Serine hydrolase domain-containing protein n=1 Tax=Xanthocytophaga flava TaxID=3048013 RepID=A0ABT7CMX8_9BACT|nr:serine hydrolase domain-containing protein [Xanthocytophaga flavus]MDJ1473483.1 serine hydrolase domain-containing protein [Xanthocytophaga flavus]MDJ1495042.1 serine hydrolase domain-containing protein [Xanthocytophaga flavus]